MLSLRAIKPITAFISLLLAAPVAGLEAPSALDISDIVFYTFSLTCIAFFSIGMIILKEFTWLTYSLYGALMLALFAALDGTLAYLSGGNVWMMSTAPLLIGAVAASFGFFHMTVRIEPPHWFMALKPMYLAFGALALLLIPAYFLSPSVVPLYATLNTLMLLMIASQILPPLTWTELTPAQHRLAILWPLATAISAIALYLIHFIGPGFERTTLDQINRAVFLMHIGHLLSFACILVLDQIKARQQALQDAEIAAREAAEAALKLERSERNFERAQEIASSRSRQLAAASHDIKQPIIALRHAIEAHRQDATSEQTQRISEAVDYLDQLAGSYLNIGNRAIDESSEIERDESGRERVPVPLVMKTVASMFEREAQQRGARIAVRPQTVEIAVVPLALTRALANLVSNAVEHSGADRILIGARREGGSVRFEVHDNGRGLDRHTLKNALALRSRGETSYGSGLGLAIVGALAEEHAWRFEIRSEPDLGTVAKLAC